jgi:hypothetical protein
LTPIFNASLPKLDFSLELALRTVVSLNVEDFAVGSLTLDLPAFNFEVRTVTNKMSNCQSPKVDTPPDEIYADLIHVTGSLNATLSYDLFNDKLNGTIETWTMGDALKECYAFLPGQGSIGAVPSSPKDSALSAPAVTTCMREGRVVTGLVPQKHLSPAGKAGIALG